MPTGIILKSASHEVSDEVREKNLAAVVEGAGYEVQEKAEDTLTEPLRNDFKSEEEFEAAHVEWQDKQDEKEEPPPKKEAEVRKLSRRERAVERATVAMKERVKELESELAKEREGKEPPKEAVRPKRVDFDNDEKFEDALLAWGVENAKKESAVKDAEAANKSRFEKTIQSYAAQVEEAKEEHEDWEELKEQFDAKDVFIGKETQLAILELENGAEVIYYLMRHPATAAKLGETCKANPISAIMEVGRLSSRLKTGAAALAEADDEEPRKPKPKVPAPVRTVGSGTSSGSPTFAEIAARPPYTGKARDLRAAQAAAK